MYTLLWELETPTAIISELLPATTSSNSPLSFLLLVSVRNHTRTRTKHGPLVQTTNDDDNGFSGRDDKKWQRLGDQHQLRNGLDDDGNNDRSCHPRHHLLRLLHHPRKWQTLPLQLADQPRRFHSHFRAEDRGIRGGAGGRC